MKLSGVLVGLCLGLLLSAGYAIGSSLVRDAEACSAGSRPRVLTDPSGSFVSLNYPSNYPDEIDCQWLIRAQPGQIVSVDFSAFDTERRFDIVWFFDGNNTLAPVILGVDGTRNQPPTGIRSTGEFMYVWFTSDALTNARGFSATYQSVDPAGIADPCYAGSRPITVTSDSGTITSQYFPMPYALSNECQWLFVAQEPNGRVVLDFTEFLTEPNNDWVVIYDGDSISSPLIARLSGNYAPAPTGITSTQQYMLVRFFSDANLSLRGWRANYASAPAA